MEIRINDVVHDVEEGTTPAQLRTIGLVPESDEVWLIRPGAERFLADDHPILPKGKEGEHGTMFPPKPIRLKTRPSGTFAATQNPSSQQNDPACGQDDLRQPETDVLEPRDPDAEIRAAIEQATNQNRPEVVQTLIESYAERAKQSAESTGLA